jgi:hypothetical protein
MATSDAEEFEALLDAALGITPSSSDDAAKQPATAPPPQHTQQPYSPPGSPAYSDASMQMHASPLHQGSMDSPGLLYSPVRAGSCEPDAYSPTHAPASALHDARQQQPQHASSLAALPREVQMRVLCCLSAEALSTLAQTCQCFAALCSEPVLWRRLWVHRWGKNVRQQNVNNAAAWKARYMERDRAEVSAAGGGNAGRADALQAMFVQVREGGMAAGSRLRTHPQAAQHRAAAPGPPHTLHVSSCRHTLTSLPARRRTWRSAIRRCLSEQLTTSCWLRMMTWRSASWRGGARAALPAAAHRAAVASAAASQQQQQQQQQQQHSLTGLPTLPCRAAAAAAEGLVGTARQLLVLLLVVLAAVAAGPGGAAASLCSPLHRGQQALAWQQALQQQAHTAMCPLASSSSSARRQWVQAAAARMQQQQQQQQQSTPTSTAASAQPAAAGAGRRSATSSVITRVALCMCATRRAGGWMVLFHGGLVCVLGTGEPARLRAGCV